jgi:alpha-L-rhamnosidase
VGTGLIGGQYLTRVLTENGRPDLAYEIATQRDYPSWGYMIEHSATTIWELWNGNTADPTMNSGNHVMLVGDLVIWMYEDLAGIKSDPGQPGFKHIIMRPTSVGDLTWVKATHHSPYGIISSEWHRGGNDGSSNFGFDWRIEVPANTTATVFVPARSRESVHADGVNPIDFGNGRAVFDLGSGKYHFVSR